MSDVRGDIGAALAGKMTQQQIDLLLNEVLAITKHARGWCPSCKKHVMCEIADAKAVTGALVDLANQAWGRPQDVKQEEAGVTFIRQIIRQEPEPPAAA